MSIQSRHPELDSGSIHLSRKGKSLREKQTLIDSGSESGMTKNCHAEVAEPQPNRSMQSLNCHAELVSASSRRGDEGSPLTPTLSCTSLRIQAHKTRPSSVRFASRRARERNFYVIARSVATWQSKFYKFCIGKILKRSKY